MDFEDLIRSSLRPSEQLLATLETYSAPGASQLSTTPDSFLLSVVSHIEDFNDQNEAR